MGFFKLKKVVCLLFLLMLCGCNAIYEVEINDDKVFEKGNLLQNKKDILNTNVNGMTFEEEINLTLNSMHDIENGQEEEKTRSFLLEKIDNDNEIGLRYEHSFSLENYETSPILKQCYDEVEIDNNEYYMFLNTSSRFNCFKYYKYLEKVTIVLTTDYTVENSNYNEKKDNKYYWYINKSNQNNGIKLNINKKDNTILDNLTVEEKQENWDYVNYILILLGAFVLISGFIVFIKIKKSNK